MKSLKILSSILAALALLAVCIAAQADDQGYPTTKIALTLSGTTVAANTTATVTSQAFSPNLATGFAVVPNIALSGTGTGNVTLNFQTSLDGSTWSTTYPYSVVVAATGTTPVIAFANVPPNVSGSGATNVPYIRLGQVINANTPSTLTINSITISKSNR